MDEFEGTRTLLFQSPICLAVLRIRAFLARIYDILVQMRLRISTSD